MFVVVFVVVFVSVLFGSYLPVSINAIKYCLHHSQH